MQGNDWGKILMRDKKLDLESTLGAILEGKKKGELWKSQEF